jgi:hypothetical protein
MSGERSGSMVGEEVVLVRGVGRGREKVARGTVVAESDGKFVKVKNDLSGRSEWTTLSNVTIVTGRKAR